MADPLHDTRKILFANETFYRAFADRDITLMAAIWADTEKMTCVHPGWAPLAGRVAVMQSWHAILSSPNAPEIDVSHAEATVHGDWGIVLCYERLGGNFLVATNIFIRADNSWLLVHHQASPAAEPPSEEEPHAPGQLN